MNIIKFNAENFKKLEAVELIADESLNLITGKNAQGKSSVLDAIQYCIHGVQKDTPEPIKKGKDKAKIEIDLGEVIVTRSITQSGSRLVVTPKDGSPIKTPQAVLDTLFNAVSFDPIRFINMGQKEQIKALLQATGQKEKIDQIERERKEVYDLRTETNRRVKELEAMVNQCSGKHYPEEDEITASEVIAEINRINQHNQNILNKKRELQDIVTEGKQIIINQNAIQEKIVSLQQKIMELVAESEKLDEKKKQLGEKYRALNKEIEETPELDIEAAQLKLGKLETHNSAVRERKIHEKNVKNLEEKQTQADEYTERLKELETMKQEIINSSAIGLPLTITEDGIYFKEVPLNQCSSAEQLKISMAVAMALQPNLKVILIREGSLLDSEGMKTIHHFAQKNGYQLWIEKVDESGEVGIVIEEGKIKKINKNGEQNEL